MRTVALVGNPNVGKSTLFNSLTGMRQHTGNWSGKTVDVAKGTMRGTDITLVDLPGIYSLDGTTEDERLAAEYIDSGEANAIVVVCDGSCLARNLILVLQILERSEKVILCVNLMDEAMGRGFRVDDGRLSKMLGIPVVLTAAGKWGTDRLVDTIMDTPVKKMTRWEDPVRDAMRICDACVQRRSDSDDGWRLVLDRMLLSRRKGVPVMLLAIFFMIWLTVWGANGPAQLLETLFSYIHGVLRGWTRGWPVWLSGILVEGVYATTARVIAVMLPPMAIFFPLFTVLEDVGYLPRMAFLLDRPMCRCGGCGKQALTMCMGLGCNAVGVTGCRIIDTPRRRLAAILTNAMIPCNGRFPTLIILGSAFLGTGTGALAVAGCVVLGVLGAMVCTGALCRPASRRSVDSFILEIPPLRRPRIGQILVRSVFDRTLFVAGRAVCVAAPAGAVLWILGQTGALGSAAGWLDPAGKLLGMDGPILLAFLLSIPANELLLPVLLMIVSGGTVLPAAELDGTVWMSLGITMPMAVCMMVFTVFHWPCATTLLTIRKETRSYGKTAAAFLLPTAVGCILCAILALFH